MKKRFPASPVLLMSMISLFLFSCSVHRQIAREADETVLQASSLRNAHVGISIFDPKTGKYLYDHQGEKYFVPASNTKIPTCYLAMKYLGDSLVGIRYDLASDSVVLIQPAGDPSFLVPEFNHQPVLDFLSKFRRIIIKTEIFDDFLGNGWSWNDYEEAYMAPRSDLPIYGNVVRFDWEKNNKLSVYPRYFSQHISPREIQSSMGFEVHRPWDSNDFYLEEGRNKSAVVPYNPNIGTIRDLLSDTLHVTVQADPFEPFKGKGVLYSQPTDSLLKPMMHRSDNFYAEQSLLMVSNALLGKMDDASIIDTILKSDFHDLPQRPRWVDGSGLSRYNLFTPQSMVSILDKMRRDFGMERIKGIFATGGTGTISNYYKNERGYIFAKTGTLSGVVAFSGFLYTKKNRLLIFSVLVNNHHSSAVDIRRAVEKFLIGIRERH